MERHNSSQVHLSTIKLGYPVRLLGGKLLGGSQEQKDQEGPIDLTSKNDGMKFDKSTEANEIVKLQMYYDIL